MSNKALSIYFIVFAVLYFSYTAFIAGHGIHLMNTVIAITMLVLGVYFALKSRRSNR